MRHDSAAVWIAGLAWEDQDRTAPKHRRLYETFKAALLAGSLRAGTKWPASRQLAALLHVSRGTVLLALEQLVAEGYLETRPGSGTRVAENLHPASPDVGPASTPLTANPMAPRPICPFAVGVPAVEPASWHRLARLAGAGWREPARRGSLPLDEFGAVELRQALADYLHRARGVQAHPDQIMIAHGAQHGLYAAASVLMRPGQAAWVEDPGYQGARAAFRAAGARLIPVPVDAEGLRWMDASEVPRLMHVTPSHQYPLGCTMSIGRRQELLTYAAQHDAYIVEDDYDSEFRYEGYPLPSLQGMDPARRVIYVGTFSKVLAPTLRLGYVVLPVALIDAFRAWRRATDQGASRPLQVGLAAFIADGQLERHIARMRRQYRKRRDALVAALPDALWDPAPAGLHLVVGLPHGDDDRAVAHRAGCAGLAVEPLSQYYLAQTPRQGLVLGYAAFDPATLADAGARLADVLAQAHRR